MILIISSAPGHAQLQQSWRARGVRAEGGGRALGHDEVFTHSLSVQDKTRNLMMRRSSLSGRIYYVINTTTITIIIIFFYEG